MDTTLTKQIALEQTGRTKMVTVDFQLKCTTAPSTDNGEFVSFSLDQEDYAAFKARMNSPRFVLGVMIVPDNISEWCEHRRKDKADLHPETLVRHCMYARVLSHREKNKLAESKTVRFKKGTHEFAEAFLKEIEARESSLTNTISDIQEELAALTALSSQSTTTTGGANA